MKFIPIIFLILFLNLPSDAQHVVNKVDSKQFMARQDMVYETLNAHWHEGAFTGNGLLGNMVYLTEDSAAVRIEIGRTDVVDHRPEFGLQYGEFRLPIGHFRLQPKDNLQSTKGRLDLYQATFSGQVNQKLNFKTYIHALYDVIVLEIEKGALSYELSWQPELSVSPRYHRQNKWVGFAPEDYQPNPEPEMYTKDGISYCYQPLLAGGGYCTAWKKMEAPGKDIYLITVGNSWPQDISVRHARQNLQLASVLDYEGLYQQHTDWWNDFYQASFVSLPDKQFESFWWIQQYKLGSATREDAPAIDLMGPWFRYTPWAAYWFNLNVQLTYSPVYSSNRLDLGQSLTSFINNNRQQLIKNVPEKYQHNAMALGRFSSFNMNSPIDQENPKYSEENTHFPGAMLRGETKSELGNLTWLLHNYYYQFSYSMDSTVLNDLYPLLKRSINYYLNIMEKWDDGKLHLPVTFSPEYPGGLTRDCNYDLSLFRWGCETLLNINAEDSLAATWQYVLENLTDYPTDENGLRIGLDVPFDKSHRHYSHLLMWYPLHIMSPNEENVELMKKSIAHWHSFDKALQGYSFTGGASMFAKMGDGDQAYDYLKTFMTDFLRANTMYLEAGPVIETPLSAATSINEMLLQSWGDTIRVLPAIPQDWQNISFENLRAEGAFLVSVKMKDGELQFVKILSEAGGKLQLKIPEGKETYIFQGKKLKSNFISVDTHTGHEIIIHKKGLKDYSITEVPLKQGAFNSFGAKIGTD